MVMAIRERLLKQIARQETCAMLLRLKVVEALQTERPLVRDEITALIHFHRTLGADGLGDADLSTAWSDYFIDQISEFLVLGEGRDGHIDDRLLIWVIEELRDDAGLLLPCGLEVLISALERAEVAPPALVRFTFLATCGRIAAKGVAQADDVARMTLVLNALVSANDMVVCQEDAARLMALNGKIAAAPNHISWNRLYAGTIGGYLLRRAETDKTVERTLALGRHASSRPDRDENWLVRQVQRSEAANPAERALLDFIAKHCPPSPSKQIASAA